MNVCYKIWDEIYQLRNEIKKERPELRTKKIKKTFKDENGIVRCSKCGSSKNISKCADCIAAKLNLAA